MMDTLLQDLRYALRQLRARPGFTAVAVLTLGLGIGANTAMFSVVDGVMLKPLPVWEQHRVLVIWMEDRQRGVAHLPFVYESVEAVRERSRTLTDVAALPYWGAAERVVRLPDGAVPVAGTPVTGTFFRVLGARPVLGRLLQPEDDHPGAGLVAVIGHGLWRRLFGGDSAVVGQSLWMADKTYTIVGVAPEGFDYPRGSEVWFALRPFWAGVSQPLHVDLVARLAPGVTREQARVELDGILRQLDAEGDEAGENQMAVVRSLAEVIVGDVRPALFLLGLAVALILVIATVNLANLLTMRGIARRQEFAVRAAIGAGRGRLVRQLLTEAFVLGVLGGTVGVAIAWWGTEALVALAPAELPRLNEVGIDGRVLAFATAISLVTAGVFGLVPALGAAPAQPATWFRGTRGAGTRAIPGGPWQGLVIGQIALTLLMLIGAGLLVRSLARLQSLDPGFQPERLVLAQLAFPSSKYQTLEQIHALLARILPRVEAIPGVASATVVLNEPFAGTSGHDIWFTAEGQDAEAAASNPVLNYEGVQANYFTTLGLPIVRGRALTEHDRRGSAPVVVVNETLARRFWPSADAIGKRIKFGPPDYSDPWRTVVGVAGDTRYRELKEIRPSVYVPFGQGIPGYPRYLILRTGPAPIVPALRGALADIDPEVVLLEAAPMEQLLAAPLAQPRFNTILLGLLGGLGLVLSAIGIYGVVAYAVSRRTHEIGVRMALGAGAADVVRLVLRQVVLLALLAIAIGLAAAFAGTRLLGDLLYGVAATDVVTFAVVPMLLAIVALLAAALPARRATRVDPMVALRTE
ncbi:MAG TPA: ABC transporter permease [Gemmatimonadales bacterium]